jgi:hypothetical protein
MQNLIIFRMQSNVQWNLYVYTDLCTVIHEDNISSACEEMHCLIGLNFSLKYNHVYCSTYFAFIFNLSQEIYSMFLLYTF